MSVRNLETLQMFEQYPEIEMGKLNGDHLLWEELEAIDLEEADLAFLRQMEESEDN